MRPGRTHALPGSARRVGLASGWFVGGLPPTKLASIGRQTLVAGPFESLFQTPAQTQAGTLKMNASGPMAATPVHATRASDGRPTSLSRALKPTVGDLPKKAAEAAGGTQKRSNVCPASSATKRAASDVSADANKPPTSSGANAGGTKQPASDGRPQPAEPSWANPAPAATASRADPSAEPLPPPATLPPPGEPAAPSPSRSGSLSAVVSRYTAAWAASSPRHDAPIPTTPLVPLASFLASRSMDPNFLPGPPSPSAGSASRSGTGSHRSLVPRPPATSPTDLTCAPCGVEATSIEHLRAHLAGAKHARRVALAEADKKVADAYAGVLTRIGFAKWRCRFCVADMCATAVAQHVAGAKHRQRSRRAGGSASAGSGGGGDAGPSGAGGSRRTSPRVSPRLSADAKEFHPAGAPAPAIAAEGWAAAVAAAGSSASAAPSAGTSAPAGPSAPAQVGTTTGARTFACDVCAIACNSARSLTEHVHSAKHERAVRAAREKRAREEATTATSPVQTTPSTPVTVPDAPPPPPVPLVAGDLALARLATFANIAPSTRTLPDAVVPPPPPPVEGPGWRIDREPTLPTRAGGAGGQVAAAARGGSPSVSGGEDVPLSVWGPPPAPPAAQTQEAGQKRVRSPRNDDPRSPTPNAPTVPVPDAASTPVAQVQVLEAEAGEEEEMETARCSPIPNAPAQTPEPEGVMQALAPAPPTENGAEDPASASVMEYAHASASAFDESKIASPTPSGTPSDAAEDNSRSEMPEMQKPADEAPEVADAFDEAAAVANAETAPENSATALEAAALADAETAAEASSQPLVADCAMANAPGETQAAGNMRDGPAAPGAKAELVAAADGTDTDPTASSAMDEAALEDGELSETAVKMEDVIPAAPAPVAAGPATGRALSPTVSPGRKRSPPRKRKKKAGAADGLVANAAGASAGQSEPAAESEITCLLCDVVCRGRAMYAAHMRGEEHRRRLRMPSQTGGSA